MKSKTLVFATLALSIHYAHALEITWADIAGNTNWGTGSSWIDGVAPNNSLTVDVAIFTSVANAQPNLGPITRSVNGIDFQLPDGGANFTSDAGALLRLGGTGIDATTQLSGTSAVSVESLEINGGSHTWTLFSGADDPAPGTTTSTFTVSSNIDLNGNALTVRSNRNSATGNAGIVNLSGAIAGAANLTLNSPSASRNTINLTGSSSYTGTTTIQQVAVTANSLANETANSAFGSSGTVVLGTNAAFARLTFQDLSADGSSDRLFSLKGTAGGTSVYIIANNDADNTVAFTNPGNTGDVTVSTANNITFALGGSNTGNNTFGQIINDRIGGGVTILRKADAGTWIVTNTNSYSGGTQLNSGKLLIAQGSSLGSAGVTFGGNSTLGATASLTLTNTIDLGTFTGTFTNTAATTAEAFDVAGLISGTGSVVASTGSFSKGAVRFINDANSYSGDFTALPGTYEFTSVADAGSNSSLGAGSGIILGSNAASVVFRHVGAADNATNRSLDWVSTTGLLNVDSSGIGTVSYLAAGNIRSGSGNAVLQVRGTNTGDNTLAQVINDSGGVTSVNKLGAGKWILTGPNSYSGATTVSEGTLSVTGANFNDASSVTIAEGGAKLDLDFTGDDTIASLTLGPDTFTSGAFSESSHPDFISGSGQLVLGAVDSTYSTWAIDNDIPGELSTDDFDADGLDNGVEYALGLDPTVSSVPAGTFTGGTVSFSKGSDAITNGDVTWIIQQSLNLETWTDEVTQPAGDNSPTISLSLPSGAGKVFTRLKIIISQS